MVIGMEAVLAQPLYPFLQDLQLVLVYGPCPMGDVWLAQTPAVPLQLHRCGGDNDH